MHTFSSVKSIASRATWRQFGAATALLFLAACGGDVGAEKLKGLAKGATRDVVLSTLGTGPVTAIRPDDQLRVVNGHRRQVFVSQARQIEVIWYREEPGSLDDRITQQTETPVVVESDTLVGWGWKFYQPFAASMKLPDPVRDSLRLDSIVRSQRPVAKPQ